MNIVIISYSAMLVYIGIAIGRFPSSVGSGFALAIVGIFIVLGSVISSMGIISYLGIGFTMISAEVIPFLVVAIGVDNMFIIKKHFNILYLLQFSIFPALAVLMFPDGQ